MKDLKDLIESRTKSIQAHNDWDWLDDYDNWFRAGMQVAKIDLEKYLKESQSKSSWEVKCDHCKNKAKHYYCEECNNQEQDWEHASWCL